MADVVVIDLDQDSPKSILLALNIALEGFLLSKKSHILDKGQTAMLEEAVQRIDQVEGEIP